MRCIAGLLTGRLWVRIPCGALRSLSLKVRTQAFQAWDAEFESRRDHWPIRLMVRTVASQAANDEFKSRMGHCGYSSMVERQIVALLMGVRFPPVTYG